MVVWNIEKNKVTELKDFEEGSIYISLTKRYMVQKWKENKVTEVEGLEEGILYNILPISVIFYQ